LQQISGGVLNTTVFYSRFITSAMFAVEVIQLWLRAKSSVIEGGGGHLRASSCRYLQHDILRQVNALCVFEFQISFPSWHHASKVLLGVSALND